MANEKIGLGIVGANLNYGWGVRAHLPGLAVMPEFDLAAVCTAHQETAEATAQKFGIRKAYWDVQALVQDPAVHLVDVCVRAPNHYEIVKAALEAGKHVFCEWPVGRTTAEAEELAALAQRKGLRTMVGAQARGQAAIQRLRELIAEGYVGRVVSATMTQFLSGTLRPRPATAVYSADRENGVSTLRIGVGHALDPFLWCLGEFAELTANISTQITSVPVVGSDEPLTVTSPDNVAITGRLRSGATATIHFASVPWHGSAFRLEVYGTEGTLVATSDQMMQFVELKLQGGRHDEVALADLPIPARLRRVPAEVPDGVALPVAQMLSMLAEGIRTSQEVSPNFVEAARRQRLLDAIEHASDTRSWVTLP